jgi:hypothetical protein
MEKDKNELTYFDLTQIFLEQRKKVKLVKQNEQRIAQNRKAINRDNETTKRVSN